MIAQKIKTEIQKQGAKRGKHDSDKLTEEASDTPIQMISYFEAKTVVTTPELVEG